MADKEQIRDAILNEFQSDEPLMDVELMRELVEKWLSRWNLPLGTEFDSWNDLIKVYPVPDTDKQQKSGLRVRIAIKLYTKTNRYLISLLESLAPSDRHEYIITAHVNWTAPERAVYQKVEQLYQGEFDDILKARHVLWAQNFRERNIEDALTQCAVAILGHELIGYPDDSNKGVAVDHSLTHVPEFPEEISE